MGPKLLPPLSLLLFFLNGCASVSVDKEDWAESKTTKPSYLVKVESLTGNKTVKPEHPTPLDDLLATELVQRLQPHYPAFWTRDDLKKLTPPTSPVAHHILHVRITKQESGSRWLRSLIGWGTGRTTMETQVSVHSPPRHQKENLSSFTTRGGSGAMPGALFTDPFLFLPATAILAGTTGLTYDAKRTAKTIAQSVVQNHTANGSPVSPKRTSDPWLAKAFPPLRHKNL
jgi:hypothetical protein